ncbi:helix-turn-helix transcriptional regulator [Isoptericola croceus]|uniref:helix-turn-helix transcriptional regulator n=1 Tax=Isoptericola croceus TaxID=3031406 RepID=UPI0023F8F800|nr:YafY family protein [Isoptericola croceus]
MLETSARLLRLLSLLQLRRDWTSDQLAGRLEVSSRTVRTDISKLRSLGYPVEARPGVAGGYRLAAGTAMPPLVLDDDEAVAVAVGLGAVATRGLGAEETSLTALAKLEQVLPARLRRRVEAIREATSVVRGADPSLDLGILSAVAAAIRSRERFRFAYTAHGGVESSRLVEPHRLVSWGSRWYLFAWDLERDDWRVFRVDRVVPRPPTGARFTPRTLPEDGVVEHVVGRVRRVTWRYRARILVRAPAEVVEAAFGAAFEVEAAGPGACRVEVGSDDPDRLALWITQLDADVEVLEGTELAGAFERLAARLQRAARTRSTD